MENNYKIHISPVNWFQIRRGLFLGSILLIISLCIGIFGFRFYINGTWTDAFVNSIAVLTGMEPFEAPTTDAGKIFLGIYSLYSGIVFLLIVGIITAPLFYIYIHKLILEAKEQKKKNKNHIRVIKNTHDQ